MVLRPGYILVIAEKPKAASKIASALGLKGKGRIYGIPYWYGWFNGRYYVVVPSAGHLFSLKTDSRGYPVFSYRWVPRWETEKGASYLKKFYSAIKSLARHASYFINACDYDIEGSVIGYLIIREFGSTSRAKRVKFSSLTKDELRKAFANPLPLDWEMIEAGLCRHELDWIWGINVSRAIMDIIKRVKRERLILSAGRVQSPTLIEAYRRVIERDTFVPVVSFTVSVTVSINNKEYKLDPLFMPFKTLTEAKHVAEKLRRSGFLRVTQASVDTKSLSPPPPFNLPDLQVEASRIYKISPAETLRIAEDLYLDGLISYPRTNSQKLPPTLNNKSIIASLAKMREYGEYATELLSRYGVLRPHEGRKEDPAHPAIYPTGAHPLKLPSKHKLIYDLIVRRYLSTFYDEAKVSTRRYILESAGVKFALSGQRVIKPSWLKVYRFINVVEREVPILKPGDLIKVRSVRILKVYSKPPQYYTRTSLLRWMESVGIGTEATRAEIIEILFKRGYLKSTPKGIVVTELGSLVANILSNMFSELTSVELTREFERQLELVRERRVSREDVVRKAKLVLEPRLAKLKEVISRGDMSYLTRAAEIGTDGASKCSLCWRLGKYSINSKILLCDEHKKAYDNLMKAYREWRRSLGVSFQEYLQQVIKLSSLGRLCKEVAELMLKNGFKPEGYHS